MPFTSDHIFDVVPVVDDEDLKKSGIFSEESLITKYRRARDHVRSASPPLQDRTEEVSARLRSDNKLNGSLLDSEAPLLGQ